MSDQPIDVGSPEHAEIINEAYDDQLLKSMDAIGRDDFYGIAAARTLRFFGEKLDLTPESHLLDLCSGIGGPARYFARTYGCRVTGIDLSEFNHRTAQERTRASGLDHLVRFRHGNALELAFPDGSFTHVFGSEAFCYFPDKVQLYQAARRVLATGGRIAFLEAACESPVRLHTEDLIGRVHYESVARYASLLGIAGFEVVHCHDTTELASKDVAGALFGLITKREQIIDAAGTELYYALLEIWAEFLAYFSERKLSHCGFVARKR